MPLFTRSTEKQTNDEPEPLPEPEVSLAAFPTLVIATAAPEPTPLPTPEEKPQPTLTRLGAPSVLNPIPDVDDQGRLDFDAVYRYASLITATFPAEKMIEMLETLPHGMTSEMRRQTAEAVLVAIEAATGATEQSILADANKKRTILSQYLDAQCRKLDDSLVGVEDQISELKRQILEKEAQIAQTRSRQNTLRRICQTEADRLERLVCFFANTPTAPVMDNGTGNTIHLVSSTPDWDAAINQLQQEETADVVQEAPRRRAA